MEERKEKILRIRKKIEDYNKFISEYGFNEDNDIFIKEDIDNILKELDEIEIDVENEK
jgi:predicted DNA binding CopG/RHH family protein